MVKGLKQGLWESLYSLLWLFDSLMVIAGPMSGEGAFLNNYSPHHWAIETSSQGRMYCTWRGSIIMSWWRLCWSGSDVNIFLLSPDDESSFGKGALHGAILPIKYDGPWPPWGLLWKWWLLIERWWLELRYTAVFAGHGGWKYGGENLKLEITPWAGNLEGKLTPSPWAYGVLSGRWCSAIVDPEKEPLALPLGGLPKWGISASSSQSDCCWALIGKLMLSFVKRDLWSWSWLKASHPALGLSQFTSWVTEPPELSLDHNKSNDGAGWSCGCFISPELEPRVPPLGYWIWNVDAGLSMGSSIDHPNLGNYGDDQNVGCNVGLPVSGSGGSGRIRGCSLVLTHLGPPLCGHRKDGGKHGHTRGCIVDLPESGSCGSDRSRGCSEDLSRSGNLGFYIFSCWFKSPLHGQAAPPCSSLMATSTNELAKQMEGLQFTDEELQVVEDFEELEKEPVAGEEKWVVGKLISPRIVEGPLLIRVYFSVWKKQPLEEATSLGPNMFLFKFRKEEDKDFVLGRCPWSFDGELLALKPYDRLLSPKEYDFQPLPIWIRIYDVPLGLMTSKAGETIGSRFGKYIATDLRDANGCMGEYLRVRVEIDCSKPLKRCTAMGRNKKTGQPRICMAKYERLPRFCFWCGVLGHEYQLCPMMPTENKDPFQFGDWLRVEHPKVADSNERKARPGIVYAEKGHDLEVEKDLKGKNIIATEQDAVGVRTVDNKIKSIEGETEKNENKLIMASDHALPSTTMAPKNKSAKRSLKGKLEGNFSKKSKKDKSGPNPTLEDVENAQEVVSPPEAPISVEAVNQPRREQ
ncbi:hypothetical protein V6N13_037214 [Hibiscus sabdariffa]